MNLNISEHNRPTTLPSTFRTLFLAIQGNFNNYDEYYTDGSINANHSSFIVMTNTSTVKSSRMHNICSTKTCKVAAIIYALNSIISKNEKSNSVIHSDSLSALLAMKNRFNVHPLIQHIHKLLKEIATLDIIISFAWIPAH